MTLPQPTTDTVSGSATDRPGSDLPGGIDVRGPRVAASLTTVVLALALVAQGPVGVALVALQVAVFGIAVVGGVARSPWAMLFRLVRDRLALGPPPEVEDPAPPRFAQACGLAVAGAGLVALLAGATTLGWALVAVVLVLSTLLASTGLCIGCELYVAALRLKART